MVSGKVLARYGLKPRRNEKMSHPTKSQLLDAIDELEAIDFESAYPQEEEERE